MQGNSHRDHAGMRAALVRHELGNVLSGLSGLVHQLDAAGLSPEQHHLLGALLQSADQLRWLVDALGENVRAADPFLTPQAARLNGVELMEQVIRCHAPAASTAGQVVLLDFEAGVPSTWFLDARLLRTVLDNLLTNATRYGGAGLVRVQVRRKTAADLVIRVCDPGREIPARDTTRMFEPGVRCARKPAAPGGSGFGLYLCRRILSGMNGTLDYAADDQQQSCFTLKLPGVVETRAVPPSMASSRLFRLLPCRLCLPVPLADAVRNILLRLGVSRVLGTREPVADQSGGDGVIEISAPSFTPGKAGWSGGLVFSVVAPGGANCLSRSLASPFLESTIGPVLLELALEHRRLQMAAAEFSPTDDGKPGSFPRLP